jgi:hypothetical protein
MKWCIVVGIFAALAPIDLAHAQTFPRHDDICVAGVVSKEKLAKAFLKTQDDWLNLYIDSVEPTNNPQRQPQWRRIFTDKNFCEKNPACLGPDPDDHGKPPKLSTKVAESTLKDLRLAFEGALETNTAPGMTYRISDSSIGTSYFLDDSKQIQCLTNEPPVAAKLPDIKLPVRLRANSDDLNIKGTEPAFKNVKPATIIFKRDGVTQKTNTAALQATIGVPIPLGPLAVPLVKTEGLSSFGGEVVPYISAAQSVSKVDGKPSTLADTNVVALGALLNTDATFDRMPGVDHALMAKPQYLWNTKDKSEIASLKFIYQPWTDGRPPAINTPFPLTTVLDGTWVTLVFDLRDDVGQYIKKGIDPKTALTHTSFNRAGSRFGFAVSTDEKKGAHVVLTVTETLLYGFAGGLKQLSFFDSSLSYYFDSTSNFGFTVTYTKGQNEDTAIAAQTVTAGLSAKF